MATTTAAQLRSLKTATVAAVGGGEKPNTSRAFRITEEQQRAKPWSSTASLRAGFQSVRRKDIGLGLLKTSVLVSGVFDRFHMHAFLALGLTASDVLKAHSVYWIWNIVNDVCAGYWIDLFRARFGSRLPLVRYLSLLWILVSLLPFWDLGLSPFVHYFMSITVFDGCLSVTCIARGSLLTELSDCEQERIGMERVATICALPETITGILSQVLWTRPTAFRCLLVFEMLLSVLLVEVGYKLCSPEVKEAQEASQAREQKSVSIMDFLRQLRRQRNFWSFVGMNCVLEMQRTFHTQFNPVLLDVLLPNFQGTMLPLLGVAEGITSIGITFVADRVGSYQVIRWSILGKIAVCSVAALLLCCRFPYAWVAACTLFIVQLSAAAATKFFEIIMSNLADEFRLISEGADVTSQLWATHAVFAKPLNSAAAVVSTQVLNLEAYRAMKSAGTAPEATLQKQALWLMLGFPLGAGLFQLLSWRHFHLHGEGLARQQQLLRSSGLRGSAAGMEDT